MLKKNFVLILILVIAIFLRFFRLDYLELFGDEVDAGYQSYSLLLTGKDYKGNFLPVYMHSFSEWRAPGMMYFMVPFIKIFGLNEWGIRVPAALWGIFSILGFYLLLLRLKISKKIALITIGFLALTPWHIQYSRAGFELTLMSALIIWGLYFLIKSFQDNRNILIIVSAVLFSLSFYTYNTANIYVPLLIVLIIFLFSWPLKFIFLQKNKLILFFSLLFSISLPLLIQIIWGHGADRFKLFSIFNNNQLISEISQYRTLDNNSFVVKLFNNRPVYAAKKIIANYTNAFSSDFLFGMGDVTFRHSLHKVGNLFWIQLPLILFGIIFTFTKKRKEISDKFLIGLLLISPIPASLTIDGFNHASRLFLLVFPLSYFSAAGLNFILENFKGFIKNIVLIGIILVFLFEFFNFQFYYWNSYKRESWRWWHYGYKEIMNSLSSEKDKYKKIIIETVYEPALIRYLFWLKINPRKSFKINDSLIAKNVDGYDGFCIDKSTCFANLGNNFDVTKLRNDTLYLISQEKSVGGDWDWGKNPPSNVRIIKEVYNPWKEPIFYLLSISKQGI